MERWNKIFLKNMNTSYHKDYENSYDDHYLFSDYVNVGK